MENENLVNDGKISVSKCCKLYNVDRKTFDTYCERFNIERIKEETNTYISEESKLWFDKLFSTYSKEDFKAMLLNNMKPFSCEGISYLKLRKELGLNSTQFANRLSNVGLTLKSNYTKDEENKLRELCSKNLNRAELRDLPYINEGWIPLRNVIEEINVSKGTMMSYVEILGINVYKPFHELSFVSKEDREKILNFINEHKDPIERKVFLSKQTCIEKFGVENGAKSEEARLKISTKVKKSCTPERTEKIHKTKLEKYGKMSTTDSEKSMKTRMERYGTLTPNSHRYNYNNLMFNSSWELYFYIYHHDIIKDDIRKGKIFDYYSEDKLHRYECDFLVNGENVEIKGDNLMDDGGNLKQMKTDILNRDKLNCMKENNVKLVMWDDIKCIMKEVQTLYGKDYINQFKTK